MGRSAAAVRSGANGNSVNIRGFTLTEMLVVVLVLGIIATVALPSLSTSDPQQLDLAAREVASAVRFAHSEAIRTGEPHGVYVDKPGQRLRVYRLNTTVSPAAPVYDVYDPLTRQLYDLNFGVSMSGVTITNVYFKFKGSFFPTAYLGFSGGTGLPKYDDSWTQRMLETGYIRLSHHGVQETINISPMTGRVTVQ